MRLRPGSIPFIFFLSALGGITPLSVDMGLPALVPMGEALHVSPAAAGLTLSFFLGGFSFGPVLLGPVSDRFGRRPILLAGCVLFILASIGCALTPSLPLLLFFRILTGIGAGTGYTLSLAIVRDLFDGREARSLLSYVSTVGSVAPMIAPTLGALFLFWSTWRTIYGFLAVAGTLVLVMVWLGFEESHPVGDPLALEPRRLGINYARIFRQPVTLGYSLVAAFNFGSLFAYVTSSPLVMIGVLHISPTFYGGTFAATALGIMGGAFANGRLNARGFSGSGLITTGLLFSFAASVGLIGVAYSRLVSVEALLPLLVINAFCFGLIGPNAVQGALHPMPDIAGTASAVVSSLRIFTGAIGGLVTALLFDGHSAHAMADMMTFFAVLSLAIYYGFVRPNERRLA